MAKIGKGSRSKTGRKPHNAKSEDHGSFEELLRKVAGELRKVEGPQGQVEMSRAERSLRLTVDRAVEGKVRDVTHLLRLMVKHPEVSASYREETIILISGTDALA